MARYVFNQTHRDELPWWNGTWTPESVPDGAEIEIQLPSDPIRWHPDHLCRPSNVAGLVPHSISRKRSHVHLTGTGTLPNHGRVSGSSSISVFDYRVHGPGIAAICLRPHPVPHDPEVLGFPPGSARFFLLTLVVAPRGRRAR